MSDSPRLFLSWFWLCWRRSWIMQRLVWLAAVCRGKMEDMILNHSIFAGQWLGFQLSVCGRGRDVQSCIPANENLERVWRKWSRSPVPACCGRCRRRPALRCTAVSPRADVCRANVGSVKKIIPDQSHRASHTQLIKRDFDGPCNPTATM